MRHVVDMRPGDAVVSRAKDTQPPRPCRSQQRGQEQAVLRASTPAEEDVAKSASTRVAFAAATTALVPVTFTRVYSARGKPGPTSAAT